jgi:hypothetical protein
MKLRTTGGWVTRTWRGSPWMVAPVRLLTSADIVLQDQRSGDAAKPSVRGAEGCETDPRVVYVNRLLETSAFRRLDAIQSLERLRRLLDAMGGAFVKSSSADIVVCDLTDPGFGKALVQAVLQANPDDAQRLTDLVSTYGELSGPGIEGPIAPVYRSWVLENDLRLEDVAPAWGSFVETTEQIRTFQRHVKWLRSLRASADEEEWGAFAESLYPFTARIRPSIRWTKDGGATPCWYVEAAADVLWATLWDWATGGGNLRRCRHCDAWFHQENPRKEFCSRVCANRASAARWYRKKGRRLRRAARRLAKEI